MVAPPATQRFQLISLQINHLIGQLHGSDNIQHIGGLADLLFFQELDRFFNSIQSTQHSPDRPLLKSLRLPAEPFEDFPEGLLIEDFVKQKFFIRLTRIPLL